MSFSPSPSAVRTASLTGREELLAMLTYKRPAGSRTERRFVKRFVRPHVDYEDAAGNLIRAIGDNPTVLFSSHTDTVHRVGGTQPIEATDDGWVHPIESDCLGADCTAGVWLMLEMIRASVPGLYIFHREEEVGGRGSAYIARHTPQVLDGIQVAIAFDRKGFSSIITHQFERCCSDAFAQSLGNVLGGAWELDPTGTFTDTANYTDLVAECTNISVGYLDQHTARERQHVPFLETLRDCLVAADWGALTVHRMAGEREDWGDDVGAAWARWDDDDFAPRPASKASRARLLEAIADHPEVVAGWLEERGYGADDILDLAWRQH
jgi:hypothetical protein